MSHFRLTNRHLYGNFIECLIILTVLWLLQNKGQMCYDQSTRFITQSGILSKIKGKTNVDIQVS